MSAARRTVTDWVDEHANDLSDWNQTIWHYGETARREFEERTGGGAEGEHWIPPLCDYAAPIHFRWPEYVTTARGEEWWIPAPPK